MAFVSEDEVKNALLGGQSQPQGIDPTSYIPGGQSAASQFISGPGQSTQGSVAVGGSKPFVNIQSYLAGNTPGQGESSVLRQDMANLAGGEVGKAQAAKGAVQAQGESERQEKWGVDRAKQAIQSAAQGQGDVEGVRSSLQATFDRPQFDYSKGAQFQSAGEALNAGNYRNQAYGRSFGGSLSQGQSLLQQQLDALNPYTQQAEKDVRNVYSQANEGISGLSSDALNYINDLEKSYQSADEALRSGLDAYGADIYGGLNLSRDRLNEYNQAAERDYNKGMQDFGNLVGGFQKQLNQGGATGWGVPVGFGRGLSPSQRDEFLNNISKMSSQELFNYFRESGYNPFTEANIGGAGPWSSVKSAFDLATGLEYTPGEEFSYSAADPTGTAQYNLIRQLLGGDQLDTKQTGKKASFKRKTPGVFEY